MKTKYIAMIYWLSVEDGGRTRLPLPSPHQYSTAARFDGHEDMWSLVLELYPCGLHREQAADVWFLSPDAPHEWLHKGALFTLYESTKTVAHGQCIYDISA